tara:strand:- start:123365 stop:123700 length:336 start_codon:yes stop_codon:yes gene_type:complete
MRQNSHQNRIKRGDFKLHLRLRNHLTRITGNQTIPQSFLTDLVAKTIGVAKPVRHVGHSQTCAKLTTQAHNAHHHKHNRHAGQKAPTKKDRRKTCLHDICAVGAFVGRATP